MDIVSYLVNLLSPVGLNSYFIHKPDGRKEDEYITFNFITNNEWYSNDEEEAEKYLVTINYMTKANKNIIPTSKKIKCIQFFPKTGSSARFIDYTSDLPQKINNVVGGDFRCCYTSVIPETKTTRVLST